MRSVANDQRAAAAWSVVDLDRGALTTICADVVLGPGGGGSSEGAAASDIALHGRSLGGWGWLIIAPAEGERTSAAWRVVHLDRGGGLVVPTIKQPLYIQISLLKLSKCASL